MVLVQLEDLAKDGETEAKRPDPKGKASFSLWSLPNPAAGESVAGMCMTAVIQPDLC